MTQTLNFAAIAELGAARNHSIFELEKALSTAIRLRHLDQKELVEVDVNIQSQTVAARKRVGQGRQGAWTELAPLLPSRDEFMAALAMLQWGNGEPGQVLEANLVKVTPKGTFIYQTGENLVAVPADLQSVAQTQVAPKLGDEHLVVLCGGTDEETGYRRATRRGQQYVEAVVELYLPGSTSGVWLGASNSWALIRMEKEFMDSWLEKGGVNVRHLQDVLGLRRITLVPAGTVEDQTARENFEIKHFINNTWRHCKIIELTPTQVVLAQPVDAPDTRKVRTLTAMFHKFMPNRELIWQG